MKDIFDPDPASPEARRLDTRREAQIDKNFHFCFLLINSGNTFMETILLTFLRKYCPRQRQRQNGGKQNFTSIFLIDNFSNDLFDLFDLFAHFIF